MAPDMSLIDLQDTAAASFPNNTVFVAGTLEPNQIVDQVLDKNITSVIQTNEKFFHEDLKRLAKLREDPPGYFKNHVVFLFPDAVDTLHIEVKASTNKEEVREKAVAFCADVKGRNVTESVIAIFEELYMNAIYDAPNEAKKQKLKSAALVDQAAHLCLVRSETQLGISFSDNYGSLNSQKFLRRLREIYKEGAGQVINLRNEGGAGIGCSLMFENASSIILGVIPGVQTLVSCVIPLGLNNRQRAEIKKSLHLVQI